MLRHASGGERLLGGWLDGLTDGLAHGQSFRIPNGQPYGLADRQRKPDRQC